MDQRGHTFSFGHYHQAPGASCGILYILVFLCNSYIPFLIYETFHLLVILIIMIAARFISVCIFLTCDLHSKHAWKKCINLSFYLKVR